MHCEHKDRTAFALKPRFAGYPFARLTLIVPTSHYTLLVFLATRCYDQSIRRRARAAIGTTAPH